MPFVYKKDSKLRGKNGSMFWITVSVLTNSKQIVSLLNQALYAPARLSAEVSNSGLKMKIKQQLVKIWALEESN